MYDRIIVVFIQTYQRYVIKQSTIHCVRHHLLLCLQVFNADCLHAFTSNGLFAPVMSLHENLHHCFYHNWQECNHITGKNAMCDYVIVLFD